MRASYVGTLLLDHEVCAREEAGFIALIRASRYPNEAILSGKISMAISDKAARLASWTMPLMMKRMWTLNQDAVQSARTKRSN
jgi:hypothetical protein